MLFTGCKFDHHLGKLVVDITRSNGSFFAPSWSLLHDYKTGFADWISYERRYIKEMQSAYEKKPGEFVKLIHLYQDTDIVMVCYERGSEDTVQCHRRLLKAILRKIEATLPAEPRPHPVTL